jgi:hypothetical protein
MDQGNRASSHTNMMIARIQRELDETKDDTKKKTLQKELDDLRAGQLK